MTKVKSNELFEYFQTNAICESLTREEVETLTAYLIERSYEQNEVISDLGEVGDAMMFIIKGRVGFVSFDGQDEVNVGSQGVGNLIGEMSFFDRKPRNLRMYCESKKVKLLVLTRPMYDRLKVEHPFIAVNILENAVVSLDHLVRAMSENMAQIEHYMHGFGRH
ncbi:cyclic nucleotide-binding protein [Thiomicrospira aerophila AL3]|uniref:Cyclic nucleotide-binding protein n=1 Tax=Thiomicrospira aerophila AL3 TaxID=717772 RepID=W0DRD7_9GAMM|nr:cyclic nucleotide-binding domain-containing protein [Thiomicrospira aerophila]AHF01165.1 cyclic nucleotide-binding protein [Thiomicrospira aerophila AL3]